MSNLGKELYCSSPQKINKNVKSDSNVSKNILYCTKYMLHVYIWYSKSNCGSRKDCDMRRAKGETWCGAESE